MALTNFNIFYSWQSYVGGYANRAYIREKINSYIKLKADTLNITMDEDSRGVPGSLDISENILKKIANSDVFICDITPVAQITTNEGNVREIPNPNVMFELGFAVRQLGWDRIIFVLNAEYGNVELVPFDIAKHKVVVYKKKDGEKHSERPLDLTYSLNEIIDNYVEILSKTNEFDSIQHDILIFKKLMSFRTEQEFLISIDNFKQTRRFNSWESKGWDYIQNFHRYPENYFINSELNEKFKDLSDAIDKLHSGDIAKNIFASQSEYWEVETPDKTYMPEESKRIMETQIFEMKKRPYPKEDSDELLRAYYENGESDIMAIVNGCNNVIEKYEVFRSTIKRILII